MIKFECKAQEVMQYSYCNITLVYIKKCRLVWLQLSILANSTMLMWHIWSKQWVTANYHGFWNKLQHIL